jgi:hypothetical protein
MITWRLLGLNLSRSGDYAGWLPAYDGGMRYAQQGGYTPAKQHTKGGGQWLSLVSSW